MSKIAFLAAKIANKFLSFEQFADRKSFVQRRNLELGGKVIDYSDDDAAVFIDDMARYHVEGGGMPLSYADRGVPREITIE